MEWHVRRVLGVGLVVLWGAMSWACGGTTNEQSTESEVAADALTLVPDAEGAMDALSGQGDAGALIDADEMLSDMDEDEPLGDAHVDALAPDDGEASPVCPGGVGCFL